MVKVWNNLQKVIQKGGKNEEKTFKKTMWTKTLKKGGLFLKPRVDPEPNKHNKSQQETHKPSTQTQQWAKKVSEEGCVKKGERRKVTSKDQLQPSGPPRAPSGPERIYPVHLILIYSTTYII